MKLTKNERVRFAIFVAFLSVRFRGSKSTHTVVHPPPPSSPRSPSFRPDWALYPLIKDPSSPLTPCPWGPLFCFQSSDMHLVFLLSTCFFSLSLAPLCFPFIWAFQFFKGGEVLAPCLKLGPLCKIHKPGLGPTPPPSLPQLQTRKPKKNIKKMGK